MINRGFSTLFNEHPVYLVLIDESGKVCHVALTDTNVNDWQPYEPGDSTYTPLLHTIATDLQIPGTYRLGLWIPDGSDRLQYDNRFAIRCANGDTQWWVSPDGKYGVNILMNKISIK